MKEISLLDCTLRDGGYVNDWAFGHSTILCMFERLVDSGTDVIEVGFLDERRSFDIDRTIQPDTKSYDILFNGCEKKNSLVMAMIDYGTCGIENLSPCQDSFLDGIRIIFKKPKMREAVQFAKQVQAKGYLVCLQLVSITSYSDYDLLELISLLNELKPFAVSMVDTYGLMHRTEMRHYFELLDYNLLPDIALGYHSHNNFQLAYSNEIEMLSCDTQRTLIADGTIYGMGKSAGNAPLELLAMYLNERYGKNYDLDQILEIIDGNILRIYEKKYWGYSLLYFLAASNDCHPSYINYLVDKKSLSVKAINNIVKMIEEPKKLNYDKNYIQHLYQEYQKKERAITCSPKDIKQLFSGKTVLLLGPGKTLLSEKDKINQYITQNNPVVISVNCIPVGMNLAYVFISNSKRYSMLFHQFKQLHAQDQHCKIMAVSNIVSVGPTFDYVFDYEDLQDTNEIIMDNALILIVRLLSYTAVDHVVLAGFDGFSPSTQENFYEEYLELSADFERLLKVNGAVKARLKDFQEQMKISFLTKSLYEQEEKNETV